MELLVRSTHRFATFLTLTLFQGWMHRMGFDVRKNHYLRIWIADDVLSADLRNQYLQLFSHTLQETIVHLY